MKQSVFTIVARVDGARLDEVRAGVAAIAADPANNAVLAFGAFDVLHFASLVIVEGPTHDGPSLILECNVDGDRDAFISTLVDRAAAGVQALFGSSPGYPGSADPATLRDWLADHVVSPAAFHIGATGRSLDRIRKEARLHDAICAFLDSEDQAGRLSDAEPAEVRARVQERVRSDPAFSWAEQDPGPRETVAEHRRYVVKVAVLGVAALILLPVLLALLLVFVPVLLVKERLDKTQDGPASPEQVSAVERDEDQPGYAQNHLASVIPVKRGLVRLVLLRTVLYAVNLVARLSATHGELGGIPSIHFAHWSLIEGGSHLVFLSNFDGSWESYLGDFIDKAATGLTAVWSNTAEFPRTTLLAFKGAADGPRFRQWARASQCATAAWYNAYPSGSMTIVDNNSSIREGLYAKHLNAKEVSAWLDRL